MCEKGEFMFLQLMDFLGTWQTKITDAVDKLLVPILIIGCSVGAIWAVVIGIKMMKADDKNAREENKQKLINIAISIVAIVVLIGLFYALRNWLGDSKNETELKDSIFGESADKSPESGEGSGVIGGTLANTFSLAKQCISMWL